MIAGLLTGFLVCGALVVWLGLRSINLGAGWIARAL